MPHCMIHAVISCIPRNGLLSYTDVVLVVSFSFSVDWMLLCSQGWLWVVIHASTEIKGHKHPIVLSSLRRFHILFHNDSSNYSLPKECESVFSLLAFCVLGFVCPFNSWFPRWLWWYIIIILICWAIIIDILRLHLLIIVFLPFEKCSDRYPFFFMPPPSVRLPIFSMGLHGAFVTIWVS